MSERAGGGRGCWKFGCFGCAALVLIPLMLVLGIAGLNLVTRKPAEQVEERFAHPVTAGSPAEPERDALPDGPLDAPVAGEGEVEFDIAYAEFEIVPGEAGEPIRVEADYDRSKFRIDEGYTENPDGSWSYRLEFGLDRALLLSLFGNSQNRIRLVLPPDVPIRLRGDVRMGAGVLDLGGLWLREIALSMRMGASVLDFSEPLREPLARLEVDGRMGGAEIKRLGNASPVSCSFEQRMGGVEVDLSGAWRNDSELRVSSRMGGLSVMGSGDVNVVVGERSMTMGDVHVRQGRDPDPSLPTVTIHASGSMSGVDVR